MAWVEEAACGREDGAEPQGVAGREPVAVGHLSMCERRRLRAALAHHAGESDDAPVILAVGAELVAREEPLGPVTRTGRLDVGGLLARLPAARDDHRALDGGALLAVDVLGVGESYRVEVGLGEVDAAV